jgi:outer membrane protein TolC
MRSWAFAQDSQPITLKYLYQSLEEHYPVASKADIQQKITSIQQKLSQTGWYPEIVLGGNVSYQSEVTDVSFIPMAPEFSKDHYTFSIDVNQPVFEAGRVSKLKELNSLNGLATKAGFEVELFKIRTQVDQFYFGVMNARNQLSTLGALQKNLEEQLRRMKVLVSNETQLPGNQFVLEAEILKVEQQKIQIQSVIAAGLDALGILTGVDVGSEVQLEEPPVQPIEEMPINRPEYELFRVQQQSLDAQVNLTNSDKLPMVSAYGRGAYGRPGFDAFNDDLNFYWIVGVKAQWSFRNWRNSDKKNQVLELQKNQIEVDKQAFSVQLESEIAAKLRSIEALEAQLILDEKVWSLLDKVVAEKQLQLNKGVITSTEYLTELNARHRARLTLELHQLQLLQANYELQQLRGNVWN